MTIARARQVCLAVTPYYHCVSRCVRRAFLCGSDRFTGRSFEHRRGWIEQRLQLLASVFAIDLCAYAVMSNHYHVVVRINQTEAASWSDDDVVDRWLKLYRGPLLAQRYLSGEAMTEAEAKVITELVEVWRERLTDLGWFMRNVNEPIAREANAEDGCTGRFWEGRYKCQALLDERALLTCMAYVDLNPVRAGVANSPETSAHTSFQARILQQDGQLARFEGEVNSADQAFSAPIPFALQDYLGLVDWTGRLIRDNKHGVIATSRPPILERLQVSDMSWLAEIKYYGKWYGRAVGAATKAQAYCKATGAKWVCRIIQRCPRPKTIPG